MPFLVAQIDALMDMQKILRGVKPVDVVRGHFLIGDEISHYIHYSLLTNCFRLIIVFFLRYQVNMFCVLEKVPCALPLCTNQCPNGYANDANGCQTCDCGKFIF